MDPSLLLIISIAIIALFAYVLYGLFKEQTSRYRKAKDRKTTTKKATTKNNFEKKRKLNAVKPNQEY